MNVQQRIQYIKDYEVPLASCGGNKIPSNSKPITILSDEIPEFIVPRKNIKDFVNKEVTWINVPRKKYKSIANFVGDRCEYKNISTQTHGIYDPKSDITYFFLLPHMDYELKS